jgi:hypothetical protein
MQKQKKPYTRSVLSQDVTIGISMMACGSMTTMFKPLCWRINMFKKFFGTIWRCMANVYWGTLVVFNLPVLLVDVGIRAKLMTEAELERTIQMLEQNIQDIAKAGI